MKILLFLLIGSTYAGTCTSISRTNYTSNQVLTSSSLNSQLNTVYGAANALDGGCITDGTLELGSFNATDFLTPLRAIQQGCKVSYSSANAVSISKCYASVNGAWLSKSTSTTVTMGCTNCASDSASQTMYIYIANGSTGSTLTGLILTGAPNEDGYDASGNKVVARFYNNASAAIDQYSIDQWVVNRFVPSNIAEVSYTPTCTWVANATLSAKYRRVGSYMRIYFEAATTGTPTNTSLSCDLPTGYLIDSAKLIDAAFSTTLGPVNAVDAGNPPFPGVVLYSDTNTVSFHVQAAGGSYLTTVAINESIPFGFANGDAVIGEALVPIVGWQD